MTKESKNSKDEGKRESARDTRMMGSLTKGLAGMAMPPPHPMTAEQDRLEDEDGPFDDGVH
ncbi:MAG: hypothetical protein JNG85_11485 [Spirochaetaceae bacterium]|nr:hypothetical protein [Spirochaetaceae bacterium]